MKSPVWRWGPHSYEGATPDFQLFAGGLAGMVFCCINPPKGPRPISSNWRRDRHTAIRSCINPPKGPRPISSTPLYPAYSADNLYQSPEGATPDFQSATSVN